MFLFISPYFLPGVFCFPSYFGDFLVEPDAQEENQAIFFIAKTGAGYSSFPAMAFPSFPSYQFPMNAYSYPQNPQYFPASPPSWKSPAAQPSAPQFVPVYVDSPLVVPHIYRQTIVRPRIIEKFEEAEPIVRSPIVEDSEAEGPSRALLEKHRESSEANDFLQSQSPLLARQLISSPPVVPKEIPFLHRSGIALRASEIPQGGQKKIHMPAKQQENIKNTINGESQANMETAAAAASSLPVAGQPASPASSLEGSAGVAAPSVSPQTNRRLLAVLRPVVGSVESPRTPAAVTQWEIDEDLQAPIELVEAQRQRIHLIVF